MKENDYRDLGNIVLLEGLSNERADVFLKGIRDRESRQDLQRYFHRFIESFMSSESVKSVRKILG